MSLLRRIFGGSNEPDRPADRPPSWMTDGMQVTLIEGDDPLEVVGESYYQDALRQILSAVGREVVAVLAPEPNNPYDPNAVAVWVAGHKVGHLSREDAAKYQPAIARLMEEERQPIAVVGRLVGAEPDKPSIGIWLDHDRTEFLE